jgi:ubiquinone/menaquinone biosynthesis C-methylase UbiE
MANRVCPWWLGYFLASPIRRWLGQDAAEIVSPYVREGMTVLEPGPGMGFFTIPLARMVGEAGRVIAVDLQPKMIAGLKHRAAKANVATRIDARVSSAETMGLQDLTGKVDFTLAFAVVHEFPDTQHFFDEVARASKSGSKVLLAEPRGHVNDSQFAAELSAAATYGFNVSTKPQIARSQAALLVKQ